MSETIAVPFVKVGNRRGLTDEQLEEAPWLVAFVKRFSDSFEYDSHQSVWLFIESPQPSVPDRRST